jgi:hypothetical protein
VQFLAPPETREARTREYMLRAIRWSESVGEHWLGFYLPSDMESALCEAGFATIANFGAAQAEERYLRNHPGAPPTPPWLTMISAKVPNQT